MDISLIVSLAVYGITILALIIGFLFGLWKGAKKAGLRLAVFLVFLIISALIAMPISKALLGINITINGVKASFSQQIINLLSSIELVADFYQSSPVFAELINAIPAVLINFFVFLILMLILDAVGYFVYLILAAIFFKKKKPYTVKDGKPVVVSDYKPEKNLRVLGGFIGLLQTFAFLFVIFLPVTAIGSTFKDLTQSTNHNVAYASTEEDDYTPTSKLLREYLPVQVFEVMDGYNSTLFAKVCHIGRFDQLCFDTLTSVKVGDEKITLRKEINNVAIVYDNVQVLATLDFQNTKLSEIDYDKIGNALNALFESGLLKSVLPEVLDYVLVNIDSAEGVMGITVPEDYKPYVSAVKLVMQSNDKGIEKIKTEIFSFFEILKALGENGVLDELQNEEIKIDNILTAVNNNDRAVVDKVVSNLLNSNITKALLVEGLNQGITFIDSLDESVEVPNIDQTKIDWIEVKVEINQILNSLLDIYDNVVLNVEVADLTEITNKPTMLLSVDTDGLTLSLSNIFEQLQNSHLLVSGTEVKIYDRLIDLFENSKYSEYVDMTVFKQDNGWKTELGYLNSALKNIKNSGIVSVLTDETLDFELLFDKLALKEETSDKTYIRNIVKPLLDSKAFERVVTNLGFDYIDQFILNYQSQLGEDVELGKIQAEKLSQENEKELVVTFFENLVVYAEELNFEQVKSDAFTAIVTSNLARLGNALDSIKSSQLFGPYTEEDLTENLGIYINLIDALANNDDFNKFADFAVAKEQSFSWNSELSLIQDAIKTLNNIKLTIDDQEKTLLQAIKDGNDISAIFENIDTDTDDIKNIVNPLSESKLMKKNLVLIINTMNKTLSTLINEEITKLESNFDLGGEKQVIINVLEAIIELYPEIKEGMNDDVLEENYQEIGEVLNILYSSKLESGVFEGTYDALIEYVKKSEDYGAKVQFLLNEYENPEDIDWVEILSIAVLANNYSSGEISAELQEKLVSLTSVIYNDQECGNIMGSLIEIVNDFSGLTTETTAESSLQLLIDSFAVLEQYNESANKVHKVINFVGKMTGISDLEGIKNINNFTTEKQKYENLLQTWQEFNTTPSASVVENLISQIAQADFAVDTMINNNITFVLDDTYKTVATNYIDNNISDELQATNLKKIFAL